MDGLLDRASPRRGSLTSLHRQSSGSFTQNSKLASSASSAQQNQQHQQSIKSPHNLCKDLDKFTRYFIIKAVQVIVQSRLDSNNKIKTDCKSTGNDWFNINIIDLPDITERTKNNLDSEVISVKTNWRFCCEISLRTDDGARVVLEHWIISNRAKSSSIQKLNSGLASPKIYHSSRSSSNSFTNSNQHSVAPSSNVIGHPSSGGNGVNTSVTRSRNATISCTRTKLNSIDDCSCDDVKFGSNNENTEPIKPSASCFTLSSASASNNQTIDHVAALMTSPSTNSLTNNGAQEQSSQQTINTNNFNNSAQQHQQQQQGTRTSAMSSIYSIYNRMSLLLKTLMTTTHIVPACKLSSKTSHSDSCSICYRVYTTTSGSSLRNANGAGPRGSVEDISCHSNSGSPNRRLSSSNSSFASVNIREFVLPDDLEHFCPFIKIGSIRTEINELEICLSYRTDMMTSCNLLKSQRKGMYSRLMDEDCITAAKQLLAGNDPVYRRRDSVGLAEKDSDKSNDDLDLIDQPLRPAFAMLEQKVDKNSSQQDQTHDGETILETAFDNLLTKQLNGQVDDSVEADIKRVAAEYENNCEIGERSSKARSEPIQVPEVSNHHQHHLNKLGCNPRNHSVSQGSTPKSLTDSFVFIDLNPPFASEEQNDLNSFFHGPSPTFCNGFDSLKDVDDLTNQLAVIEANAEQIDDFVDNICASEDEENENDSGHVD